MVMKAEKSVEQRMLAAAQKLKRETDAIAALKEYHAEKARIDVNTQRLRALRLAKEATIANADPAKAVKSPRVRTRG